MDPARLPFLILIIMLSAICIAAGCTAPGPVPDSGEQATETVPGALSDLREAVAAFEEAAAYTPGEIEPPEIFTIRGSGVTQSGSARSWVIGTRINGSTIWMVYGIHGLEPLSLQAPAGDTPILLAALVYPDTLYSSPGSGIGRIMEDFETEATDLALSQGMYRIFVRNDTEIGMFEFDAYSGELMKSP